MKNDRANKVVGNRFGEVFVQAAGKKVHCCAKMNFSCEEKFISSCKGTQNIDKEQCKKGCNLIKPHHFSTQNGKMQNISRISSFCIRLHSLVYQFIKLNSAKNKLLFTREVQKINDKKRHKALLLRI